MAFIRGARRAYKKSGLRKTYRKVRNMAKKRYSNRGNIAKDVAMLKSLVNVEKKRSDITVIVPQLFAQRNTNSGGNVDAFYSAIISPTVIQGVTGDTRTGNSIKLTSGCLDLQIAQGGNTSNNLKIKLWIVCRPDNASGYSASVTANQLLEVNPFSSRRDFYSNRDPEYFHEFRVVKAMTLDLKQDSITSGITYIQKKVPLKFNHHLKYNQDGSSITTKNQFYLIATCSDGDTNLATGATIVYNMRWYFTDN